MGALPRKGAAIAAGLVVAVTALVGGASSAQAVGPASCYTGVGNSFGAWHQAYGYCGKGYGHYQVVGTFRNLAGDTYKAYGSWVTIGKTSTANAAGWLDTAVKAELNTRIT